MLSTNLLSFIFVDANIQSCVELQVGIKISYIIGIIFRLAEFGIVSAIPPLILIFTSNKYNTIIAATLTFFGMKFFTKFIETFSQDSTPNQLRYLRESNARLEESNARLEELAATLKESNARLEKQNKNIMDAIANLPIRIQENFKRELNRIENNNLDRIRKCEEDIEYYRPFVYQPYDSPSNGSD